MAKAQQSNGSVATQFQPGIVTNPNGRPPTHTHVRELARQYTEECMNILMQCVRDENERWVVRQSAAQMVLDRGWGKAATVVMAEGVGGQSTTITMLSTDAIKQLLLDTTQPKALPEPTQPQPTQAVIADT